MGVVLWSTLLTPTRELVEISTISVLNFKFYLTWFFGPHQVNRTTAHSEIIPAKFF
jgi:hypothetical protein